MKLSDPEVRVYFAIVIALAAFFLRPGTVWLYLVLVFAGIALHFSNQVRKTSSTKGKILLVISGLVFILGILQISIFRLF